VFERFYRVAGSVSDGSGLGLPIAHEIAVLHGGQLRLQMPPTGSGLIVEVQLPATLPPAAHDGQS
jgi:two-component system sensor histidine kinase TctE